jgi:carboxypeptidase C (cathepsin A)
MAWDHHFQLMKADTTKALLSEISAKAPKYVEKRRNSDEEFSAINDDVSTCISATPSNGSAGSSSDEEESLLKMTRELEHQNITRKESIRIHQMRNKSEEEEDNQDGQRLRI